MVTDVKGLNSKNFLKGGQETILAKGAEMTDILIISNKNYSSECEVLKVGATYFQFRIPEDIVAGTYTFTLLRGEKTQVLFDATISIKSVDTYVEDKPGLSLRGLVYCGTSGVKGVLVSDGVDIVETNEKGHYWLQSDKRYEVVYIILPYGYNVKSSAGTPVFWANTSGTADDHEQHNFELEKVNNDRNTVLVATDIHLTNREQYPNNLIQFRKGFVKEVTEKYGSKQNVYCLNLGDFAQDIYWYTHQCGLDVAKNQIASLPFQFWSTMGNHDNDGHTYLENYTSESYRQESEPDKFWAKDLKASGPFRHIMGPTHIALNIGKVHYILIDDIKYLNDYPNTKGTSSDQLMGQRNYYAGFRSDILEWLKKDLKYVSKSTPIVVGMHIPLCTAGGDSMNGEFNNSQEWHNFLQSFNGYDEVEMIVGHSHLNRYRPIPGYEHIYEHNIVAVSGIWWNTSVATGGQETSGNDGQPGKLSLASDGCPTGYFVYDVNGTSRTWHYKGVGCADDKMFKSYDMNQVKSFYQNYPPAKEFADAGRCKNSSTSQGSEYLTWSKKSLGLEEEDNTIWLNIWGCENHAWNKYPAWTITVTEDGVNLPVTQITYARDPLAVLTYDVFEFNQTGGKAGGTMSASSQSRGYNPHMYKAVATKSNSTIEIKVVDRFGKVYKETMARPKKFYTGTISDSWTLE